MEIESVKVNSIKLTANEKDILDKAFGVIDRLNYVIHKSFTIDGEKLYTARDVRVVLSVLEDLVDAKKIISE